MDSDRYERIRELFLQAEELPPGEQQSFLLRMADGDVELYAEVASLLAEHDPAAAQAEGECVQPMEAISSLKPSGTKPDLLTRDQPSETFTASDSKIFADDGPQPSREHHSEKTHLGTKSGTDRALITQQGALRTHASPRYESTPQSPKQSASMSIWADRARKSRRRNSGWLWLAALLPTAMVGWWTYDRVANAMQETIDLKLEVFAKNISLATDRYLSDQALLAKNWASQPALKQAVEELVEFADADPEMNELRKAPQIDQIHQQLKELSGNDELRFVVWDSSYRVVASWLEDRADVGHPVHPSGASYLTRVMAGETVLYGPARLKENTQGFVPETLGPVMAFMVPVKNDKGRIIASLLIRSTGSYEKLNQIFTDFSVTTGIDAYAINPDGIMVTQSPHATSLATQNRFDLLPQDIAAELRVSDPGLRIDGANRESVRRAILPVTAAVAGVIGRRPGVSTEPYSNYAGEKVVGAWYWLEQWGLGIIVEEASADAFAPARLVRFSFFLLGSLLSVTAFLAAARIARVSTDEHAAVHPLSRYDVIGELGSGGMGVVFRGRHRQLGRDVALKLLRSDRHTREDKLRFEREAKLAASLSNPHSVKIYDYGHGNQGESFCVMQFLEGLTLYEVIARSGYQAVGRTLSILRQICDALSEAHSLGLMHRDIKPQNIMLSLDPSVGDWAIVFDYGLAKPLDPETSIYQTSETIWAGTPMYMAPERFRDPSINDPRSDLYSVGCIGYFLLTGQPPFIESDPETLFSLVLCEHPIGIGIHRGEEVAKDVSDLIFRCMAKQMDARFASISDLAHEIDLLRIKHEWTTDQARVWWSQHGGN